MGTIVTTSKIDENDDFFGGNSSRRLVNMPEILVIEQSDSSATKDLLGTPEIRFADMKLTSPTHLVVGRLSGTNNLEPPQVYMVRSKSPDHLPSTSMH